MYYYKIKGENVVKLEVELDKENIKTIRNEIIENCSDIKHESYVTIKPINPNDFKCIKNYSKKVIGKINYNDFKSTTKDEYLVEYDKYYYPEVISFIDGLLSGNASMIEKITTLQIEEKPENQKLLNYRGQLLSFIKLYIVDTIPLQTILNVRDFLANCNEKTMDDSLNKKLILRGHNK